MVGVFGRFVRSPWTASVVARSTRSAGRSADEGGVEPVEGIDENWDGVKVAEGASA